MKKLDLNQIPFLISKKVLTKKMALDYLTSFLFENYPVFNLQNYDQDFRSDVVLKFIEKGNDLLDKYNPNQGAFFSYLYTFVQGIILSVKKKQYSNKQNEMLLGEMFIRDNYLIDEELIEQEDIDDELEFSENIENTDLIPDNPNLLKLINKTPRSYEKIILILALKSAYTINDEQIEKISKICNMNKDELYGLIDLINQGLSFRITRKKNLEERRNKAFHNHIKYGEQIYYFNTLSSKYPKYYLESIEEKYKKQTQSWKNINKKINNGYIYLRPTNKAIAEILGICERQVNYYISAAHKLTK